MTQKARTFSCSDQRCAADLGVSGGMSPRKILKKVVYSRRKIEIIRKNLSPRVDLPAQRGGGGLKPPPPSYGHDVIVDLEVQEFGALEIQCMVFIPYGSGFTELAGL